jgi:hypothetical protein
VFSFRGLAMAVTNRCKFPHDLNYAIKLLDDDLGNRFLENQQLLAEAEAVLPGLDELIDEGTNILDELMTKNGSGSQTSSSLTNTKDVTKQYGLLPDKPTTEEQEKFLFNAGIILIDGVWYLAGTKSDDFRDSVNIETLRRLYFALGKDLKKTEDVLKNSVKTVFISDKMDILQLPKKGLVNGNIVKYSLEDIQKDFKQDQLTDKDIAYTADGRTLVLTKSFVAIDKSISVVINNSKIPYYRHITNVFHLNGVDNSTSAINRYKDLGYKDVKLNSILDGVDFAKNNTLYLSTSLTKLKEQASKIISILDFIEKRMSAPNYERKYAYGLTEFYDQINLALQQLINDHESFLTLILFLVSNYLKKDILDLLRQKHSDEKIKYLLEKRQEVTGIYFNPPDDVFMAHISKAITAAAPNSTSISNQFINNFFSSMTVSNPYDQKKLLDMYAKLIDAKTANEGSQDIASVKATKQALYDYIGIDPVAATSPTNILQGQPSAATPSTVATGGFDVPRTMDFSTREKNAKDSFKDLYNIYPEEVAGPLIDVLDSVVSLFTKACVGIDTIISSADKTLLAMKKRLDAWLSKQNGLTGQGDYSSSLLKCSINWDIGVSLPLLDKLYDFLMRFVGKVIELLSKIQKWISNILTKLICMPSNILNSFLNNLQQALPSACKIPRFDLGDKINASLSAMMNVCTTKGITLKAFEKDIAKLKVSVSAAPDRLGQFKSGALCDSSATSNFMNAAILNVNVGIR